MDLTSLPKLWIPGPLPGLNEIINAKGNRFTKGGSAYGRLKKKWCGQVAKIASLTNFPKHDKGHVVLVIYEKDARRDFDNVASGAAKLILDGLVDCGVLPGDGRKHVLSVSSWVNVDKENPGAFVFITPTRITPTEADHFILTKLQERVPCLI